MGNTKSIISADHRAELLGQDSPGTGRYDISEKALKMIKKSSN